MADETKRRGRPRSEHARLAVLAAAAELLLDFGLDAVSMDQIAEHACVSKATIYRWWPSKPMLALDALLAEWEAARPQGRDTGTLRGDLIYGPLYHRLFHGHAPLNERIAVKVVDAALAGILAPAPR